MSKKITIKRMAGKKQKRKPTIKQKQTFKRVVENRGKSISAAMKEEGYTDATAKNPKNLTESDAWQDLIEQYLPDEDISKTHRDLLLASKIDHYVFPLEETNKVIKGVIESIAGCKLIRIRIQMQCKRAYFWIPDNKSRKDAIDMAYKLKGKYAPEKHKVEGTISLTQLFEKAKDE